MGRKRKEANESVDIHARNGEHPMFTEVLKAAGYRTFFGGKWHLGGDGFLPESQGFDVNYGGILDAAPRRGKKYFSPYGNPKLADGPDGEHICERLATEATEFMGRSGSQPFLVYLPFYSVHTPLMTRPELERKYADKRQSLPGPQFARESGNSSSGSTTAGRNSTTWLPIRPRPATGFWMCRSGQRRCETGSMAGSATSAP